MLPGRVALVAGKTITGMLGVESQHLGGTCHLGQDRSCGNGRMPSISLHHSLATNMMPRQPIAVHQQVLRYKWQAIDGTTHGQVRGMVDIELIDLGMTCFTDSESKRLGANLEIKLQEALRGELLRIIQPRNRLHRVEDN